MCGLNIYSKYGVNMITIIDTLTDFEHIKPIWISIEQDNHKLRIFQSYSWCKVAWEDCVSKEQGARLWILHWHQEGKDESVIFPFYIDGKGCLRFIMDTHSDICDAVYGANTTNRHWAYKEAADEIVRNRDIKSVWLQKMAGDGEALNYFSVLLPGCVVNRDNAFSWLQAEQGVSFIAGQTQLKRKDRDRLKAILRKSNAYGFRILTHANNDAYPVDDIKRLRDGMVGRRRKNSSFLADETIEFMRHLYENGGCEIPVIEDGAQICALAFRLLKGNRINYWVVLYENKQVTTELYLRYMEEKSKAAPYIYDFGVGAYAYKLGTYRPFLGATFSLYFGQSLLRQLGGLLRANVRLAKDVIKARLIKH